MRWRRVAPMTASGAVSPGGGVAMRKVARGLRANPASSNRIAGSPASGPRRDRNVAQPLPSTLAARASATAAPSRPRVTGLLVAVDDRDADGREAVHRGEHVPRLLE